MPLKLDAEGFPIAEAPKVDAEGFPIAAPASVVPPDFAAYKASQQPAPYEEGNSEFAPVVPGEQSSPSVAPSLPSAAGLLTKLKAIPGRLAAYATEKGQETVAAQQAQLQKMGPLNYAFFQGGPELALEAGKSVVGKAHKLFTALSPNRAKENAQWAESDMRDLLKEVGDKVPTPEQMDRFRQRHAYAEQMWGLSEKERGARQQAVQGFQERMDKATLPGTPAARLVGGMAPLAAQAALAPGTIPIEAGINAVATGDLNNPTYEQTTGQQIKEGLSGYGFGKLMMAGVPGVPIARALQGAGVSPVPANLAGLGATSVVMTQGGHQLERYLTTPHGDIPAAPGVEDYARDFATQLGLGAHTLGQRLVAPAGAPAVGQPSAPVDMGVVPRETPQAPGSLNAPPVESRPLPEPLAASHEPVRSLAQVGERLGSLNPLGPESPPFIQPQTYTRPLTAEAEPSKGLVTRGIRVEPSPTEGLPDAYGLAPVETIPKSPTAYKTLHEHEAEMSHVKQQRQADREAFDSGPLAATADISPEHHAEADRIIEARHIVSTSEQRALEAERQINEIQFKNAKTQADRFKEGLPPLEAKDLIQTPDKLTIQAKNRMAPDDPLRVLAASEPEHPDAQRALQVAQEQQQALAPEYAAGTPKDEGGDIFHARRVAIKNAPDEPSLWAKTKEFFGGEPTMPPETGIPGSSKRPLQKDPSAKKRLYETVDGPVGPTVIYKGEPGDTSFKIVGRSGKIQEADITSRRESTKDEITHATSQVEVPGEIDPETGVQASPHVEIHPEEGIQFSRNAVASATQARETARDAIRGRQVLDNLKSNPKMFLEGSRPTDPKKSDWRSVSELPISNQAKMRLAPGGKEAYVRSDVANTLVEYFGTSGAKEAHFFSGLDRMSRQWIERGFMTNPFIHFPNQFAHGLGALAGEGLTGKQASEALAHAYREGSNPNSEYVNRAKAAGVKQMSEGRVFGQDENMTAHEAATQRLEKALGHEPGTLGKVEGNQIKNGFKAVNQKAVWQVDDAIRNTLFYQKIASGMTPAEAAKYANENYVGYHTDTNLFELNPDRSPRDFREYGKKAANYLYSGFVTGKGQSKNDFQAAGGTLARTLIAPLFHTFRTNSAMLLGHEIKGAGVDAAQGSLKGLGKLANTAAVGTAVGGIVGQTLSDALLSEKEKKQGKEYQMRMGGPFHWWDTAQKALEGRANKFQTAAAIATPNPLFKHLVGKVGFGTDVSTGRRAPATSLSELGDTALSSVLPTGDIGRNALQGQGSAKDMTASFLMGKNVPNAAFQMMLAHPDTQAAGTPDYEQSKANFALISKLRELEPGTKEYAATIQDAVKEGVLTKRQIENAAKRSNQSELEHARALAKFSTPEWAVKAADEYAERSPEIARALYAEAEKKLGAQSKKFTGERSLKLLGQIQGIENKKLLLR